MPRTGASRADLQGPPPGGIGLGTNEEHRLFRASGTPSLSHELPAESQWSYIPNYTMPAKLAALAAFKSSGVVAGDELPAPGQGWYFYRAALVNLQHRAMNGPMRDTNLAYENGGFAFEWIDEWGKSNEFWEFHSSSGDVIPKCSAPCVCSDLGPTNVNFPGGWWDEQWFGMSGVKVSPTRKKNDLPKWPDPKNPHDLSLVVVNPANGQFAGQVDILQPRAGLIGLCIAYGGCGATAAKMPSPLSTAIATKQQTK